MMLQVNHVDVDVDVDEEGISNFRSFPYPFENLDIKVKFLDKLKRTHFEQ